MIEVKQSCSYLTVRQYLSQYKDFPNLPEYNFTIEVVSDTTFIWFVIYKLEWNILLSPYMDHIHCKMFDKFTTFIVQLIDQDQHSSMCPHHPGEFIGYPVNFLDVEILSYGGPWSISRIINFASWYHLLFWVFSYFSAYFNI